MKKLIAIVGAALALMSVAACDRAKPNSQTVVSSDCGKTWRLIPVGATVPAAITQCDLKTTIPNYPMTGEAKFRGTFEGRALSNVELGYSYEIKDPMKFIRYAKYLGKQGTSADDGSNDSAKYENAENQVIDIVLRDVAMELLLKQSIVDFNQSAFEAEYIKAVNEKLSERGVEIQTLALNFIPDQQTRQAIDVASARNVYASIGATQLGDSIMIARSGATQISITQAPEAPPKE